jgi:hypothetical protein
LVAVAGLIPAHEPEARTRQVETTMTVTNKEPYQQAYYPPKPTKLTCFMRKFLPWQMLRFAVINFKMIRLMGKSHH